MVHNVQRERFVRSVRAMETSEVEAMLTEKVRAEKCAAPDLTQAEECGCVGRRIGGKEKFP